MMRMLVLVVCIACGGPPRPAQHRGHADEETAEPAANPSDAGVDTAPPPALTCETYDSKNPACAHDCRFGDCKCPSPPRADIPACQSIMPCPHPPDVRVRACHTDYECSDPSCANPPGPVVARVIKTVIEGNEVFITIAAGSDQGVAKDWTGVVLAGDSNDPIADLVILRIAKHQTVARVHLDLGKIQNNPRVRLTPPH